MMPDDVLSTTVVSGNYLFPDNSSSSKTVDYELGGVALRDPSQGSMVKVWTANLYIDGSDIGSVYIGAADVPETLQFSGFGITEISLAFDQNMNPFIGFVQSGAARFWWFDPTVNEQVFSDLPPGTGAPKATLDDKRPNEQSVSDIIMAYTRSNNLYFRMQRDRYEVEYLLKTGVTGQVLKVGMNDRNRLQFAIGTFE